MQWQFLFVCLFIYHLGCKVNTTKGVSDVSSGMEKLVIPSPVKFMPAVGARGIHKCATLVLICILWLFVDKMKLAALILCIVTEITGQINEIHKTAHFVFANRG